MTDNAHKTWAQGRFVDSPQYRHWPEKGKQHAHSQELLLVRPSPTGNAICKCNFPADAAWIAERLNLAAKLEAQLADKEGWQPIETAPPNRRE
jgi:hypothetical protein